MLKNDFRTVVERRRTNNTSRNARFRLPDAIVTVAHGGQIRIKVFFIKQEIRSVERGICPIAAVCTVLLCCHGHVILATPTFRKLLSGVTSRLSLEHACQI